MPEPTKEELLKERESFNLREHLQSLKDAGEKVLAVTEQEISKLADELSGKSRKRSNPSTESEKPNAD